MTEPINLNKARKARARADKLARAEANRAKHGRTKADKQLDPARDAKRESLLDGVKRPDGSNET